MKLTIVILVMYLSTVCSGYLTGDFDCNGIVDFYDFAKFAEQWLETDDGCGYGPIKLKHLSAQLEGVGGIQRPIRIKRLCGFQLDEDWVNNATKSGVTLSNDTTHFKVGNQGLKITPIGDAIGYATHYANPDQAAVDVRSGIGISIYMADVSKVRSMILRLHEDTDFGKYYTVSISIMSSSRAYQFEDGKWITVWLPRHKFSASTGSGHEPSDWGTPAHPTYPVLKVTLYVQRIAGQAGEVTFGEVMALDPPKAAVIISFDGVYQGVYTYAYPMLKARGWPATAFAVTGWTPEARNVLTVSQYRELYDAGWDISSHSVDMFDGLDHLNLTEDKLRADLARTKNWLLRNGFYRGSQIYSMPWNHINTTTRNAVDLIEEFFLASRGIGYRSLTGYHMNNGIQASSWLPGDWLQLASFEVNSDGGKTFAANYKSFFDNAIARREVLAIYCHNIEDPAKKYQVTPALWNDMINYLDDKVAADEVEIISYTDWYNRIMGRPGSVRQGFNGDVYINTGDGRRKAY